MEEKDESLLEKLARIKEKEEISKEKIKLIFLLAAFIFSIIGWGIIAYVDWKIGVGLLFVLWGENIINYLKKK